MKDNDQSFKILLQALLAHFLKAFVPDLHRELEIASLRFLDREQNHLRKLRRVDILVEARLAGKKCYILVLVEIQSQRDSRIGQRLHEYMSCLTVAHGLPVFPVVLITYPAPRLPARSCFRVMAGPFEVATLTYRNVVLKSFDWRRFVRSTNPAEIALMATMKIAPEDRVRVKAQIFRLLATSTMDAKKLNVIAGFVEHCLEFDAQEQLDFQRELGKLGNRADKAKIMELMTSWEKKGLEKGLERGLAKGLKQGLEAGMLRARQLAILDALEARFEVVPQRIKSRVLKLTREADLRKALREAITTTSLDQFRREI